MRGSMATWIIANALIICVFVPLPCFATDFSLARDVFEPLGQPIAPVSASAPTPNAAHRTSDRSALLGLGLTAGITAGAVGLSYATRCNSVSRGIAITSGVAGGGVVGGAIFASASEGGPLGVLGILTGSALGGIAGGVVAGFASRSPGEPRVVTTAAGMIPVLILAVALNLMEN